MDPALNNLLAATVCFVGGHFILSSEPLRARLMRLLGEWVFRAAYSVIVFAALIWMAVAYRATPVMPVWTPPEAFVWVPLLVMPVALVLAVSGMTTPNPTMVAGERLVDEATGPTARGIVTITRHPFLWGTTLWALSHLSIRGDLASIALLGGILVLSLGGMVHIDRRREAALGSAWGPIAMTTGVIPFAAIAGGRTRLDWAGIGWWRPLAGLALYAILLPGHGWIVGVPLALP